MTHAAAAVLSAQSRQLLAREAGSGVRAGRLSIIQVSQACSYRAVAVCKIAGSFQRGPESGGGVALELGRLGWGRQVGEAAAGCRTRAVCVRIGNGLTERLACRHAGAELLCSFTEGKQHFFHLQKLAACCKAFLLCQLLYMCTR